LFFPFIKIVSIYAAGTILLFCERAAKVRKDFRFFGSIIKFFVKLTAFEKVSFIFEYES